MFIFRKVRKNTQFTPFLSVEKTIGSPCQKDRLPTAMRMCLELNSPELRFREAIPERFQKSQKLSYFVDLTEITYKI